MASLRIYLCILFAALGLISSCMPPQTKPKQLDCPEPQQNCRPGKWAGIPMDTSIAAASLTGFFYRIEPVQQINTPADEWQLSFYEPRRAAITYTDGEVHHMMIARIIRPELFTIESGMYIPMAGHVGAISFAGEHAAFASVPQPPQKDLDDDNYEIIADSVLIKMPEENIMGNSNIYIAQFSEKRLQNVENAGNKVHRSVMTWESQPAISPDGNSIIFASDREGGIGGIDLWITRRNAEGKWSAPVNLGESVNSRCDEITPFITSDGRRLYFSSNGRETVGGFDMFRIEIDPALWDGIPTDAGDASKYFADMRNLRAPLNTQFDELFPTSPGDPDSLLYYSSNQLDAESLAALSGGFDIFVRQKIYIKEFERDDPVRRDTDIAIDTEPEFDESIPEPIISPTFSLEGRVFDESERQPIGDAEIIVREMPLAIPVDSTRSDISGRYRIGLDKDREYEVTAQTKNLFFDSYNIRIDRDDTVETVSHDFYIPETLTLRINFPTDEFRNPYRFTLDSNGVATGRTWQKELDVLASNILKSKENVEKIVLKGHTDDVASVEYNQALGRRRVEFIIDQLAARAVPRELLEGRSAGELEPLDRRPDENLSMYRKRLRRVTLEKIIK
ncbi:MAG: hypothetical protein ACLFQX_05140 [Candidatus Kapaibacterium sp.]